MADIQVYECSSCQKKYVQPKRICSNCQGREFERKIVAGKGKVYSHTTIHISSQEFADITPYTIALIELEAGLKVTGRVNEQVAIGDDVTCMNSDNNLYLFEK